jgi:hypothetical protein
MPLYSNFKPQPLGISECSLPILQKHLWQWMGYTPLWTLGLQNILWNINFETYVNVGNAQHPKPLKVKNRLDLLACRWRATYHWKALSEGYNFASKLTSIRGLNTKLWASKVVGVLGKNDIWVQAPWPGTNNTVRGKVVGSLKSKPWWVLWICVCSWLFCAPKMFQLWRNQLIVWFMQVLVNNWLIC